MLRPDSPLFLLPSECHIFTKRYCRVLLASLFIFSAIHLLRRISDTAISTRMLTFDPFSSSVTIEPNYPNSSKTPLEGQVLPPLYEEWNQYERNLSQNNESLAPPEGKSARFLFMADHAHASGWGNILQEMILNAHLAYATNRAFVFDNYTWDRHESNYSEFNGKIIPSRIPVSTMLSGPIIGGPFLQPHPRAIHLAHYRSLCPNPTIIHTESIKSEIASHDGLEVMTRWVGKIQEVTKEMENLYGEDSEEVRCLEMARGEGQVFDIWLFGEGNVLSLWPTLRDSPILKQFGFSPLILSAYETNRGLFESSSGASSWGQGEGEGMGLYRWLKDWLHLPGGRRDISQPQGIVPTPIQNTPSIPGLLTIHLRRGDFEEHCRNLAEWNSEYEGFNAAEEFDEDDKLGLPPREERGEGEKEEYRRHCYPSIREIVEKVERVRRGVEEEEKKEKKKKNDGLKRIYIMSNAPKGWLEELKDALTRGTIVNSDDNDKWEAIQTSRDLELSWEEKYVAQSLDMYVGMRSEVFIGNGFSSLTSNIVMMRMVRGVEGGYTRLW